MMAFSLLGEIQRVFYQASLKCPPGAAGALGFCRDLVSIMDVYKMDIKK